MKLPKREIKAIFDEYEDYNTSVGGGSKNLVGFLMYQHNMSQHDAYEVAQDVKQYEREFYSQSLQSPRGPDEGRAVTYRDAIELTDRDIRLARQADILNAGSGKPMIYEAFGKMHRLKVGFFFCIVFTGDPYTSHWYTIRGINNKQKTLTLLSLQNGNEYEWKYKGGKHHVIPVKL